VGETGAEILSGSEDAILNRLAIALAVYAVLGVLAWTTLSDQRIRLVTVAILALFAVKSWARRKDIMHPDGNGGHE
jgi:hypothetical protein